jgi:hypothetical protein
MNIMPVIIFPIFSFWFINYPIIKNNNNFSIKVEILPGKSLGQMPERHKKKGLHL